MSARDRRRQRAKSNAPAAGAALKRYRVHLIIVLVFGAIVAAMVVDGRSSAECPGHWHSSDDVFVHGQRVPFSHPKFTLEGSSSYGGSMPVSSHKHQGDDFMWHFEPSTANTCVPYGDGLRFVDMELEPGRLVLDGAHAAPYAGTYRDGENGTVRAEHCLGSATSCEEWQPISISRLLDRQLRPNERVIVWFGNETEATAEMRETASAHNIQGSSGVGGSSYVPAVGVGILGLVVLGAWHALSRKA